ncbi:MAG: hypothetical protein ACFHWX_17115 [Bacteroidota bacterium]
MLGVIYQFYYEGGDTFTYFTLGSKWIWRAFMDDPFVGFNLIFGAGDITGENFQYAQHIYSFGDTASYFVVRVAGFFDILTFSTYSSTALLFATFGFAGQWAMYLSFVRFFPAISKYLAYVILFLPSLFFWGSGLLKDTLTLGALGFLFYGITDFIQFKKSPVINIVLAVIGFWIIYTVKIYIVACFIPAVVIWTAYFYQDKVKNIILRLVIAPIILGSAVGLAGYAAFKVGEDNDRYSFESLAFTAESTAKWNYYVSNRDKGSGYTLGDFDFSFFGLASKFVPAVITSFFRPFLWEVRNPVMLLSALENLVIIWLVLNTLINLKRLNILSKYPILILCLLFAIFFGFAVGVTTYNFGSLVRYRIPMIPFLLAVLIAVKYKSRIVE